MKLCLFGGTFDPPHVGHLLIAQTVFEAENFDRILFVPTLNPPHKLVGKLSGFNDRLEMLRLAVAGNPHFEISDCELRRGGVSYTIDTIREIRKRYGLQDEDTYLLIGSDTLSDLKNWKDPQAIIHECRVLVAVRPGFRPSDIPGWILGSVRLANIPRFEISASDIRRRWRKNMTIRYMVTQPVWEYINSKNLYQ